MKRFQRETIGSKARDLALAAIEGVYQSRSGVAFEPASDEAIRDSYLRKMRAQARADDAAGGPPGWMHNESMWAASQRAIEIALEDGYACPRMMGRIEAEERRDVIRETAMRLAEDHPADEVADRSNAYAAMALESVRVMAGSPGPVFALAFMARWAAIVDEEVSLCRGR